MKQLLLLFFCSLLITRAYADCSSDGISVWPLTKTIPASPVFIVGGYAMSQELITGLSNSHKAYLKSGKTLIELKVVRVLTGEMYLTQAILKPITALVPGLSYSLYIEGMNEYDENISEFRTWKVVKDSDTRVPEWQSDPTYSSKSYTAFGCGPAKYVNFCACVSDRSPVAILTKIRERKTGKISEYYLIPDSSGIEIGHGMCAGAFRFLDGEEYEAQFSLMDASGNSDGKFTDAIDFVSPTEEDQSLNEKKEAECGCVATAKDEEGSLYIIIGITFLTLLGAFVLVFAVRRRTVALQRKKRLNNPAL